MKFFLKILSSLLVCALLPYVIMHTVDNHIFAEQYQQEVNRAQARRLQAVESAMEILLENFEQHAMRVAMDSDINAISLYKSVNPSSPANQFMVEMMRIIAMLNNTVVSINMIDSVYLYVAESNYVITPRNGLITLDAMADQTWLNKYVDLHDNRTADRFVPAHTVGVRPSYYSHRCVAYVYPIRYVSMFDGALVFNIYEDAFLNLITADDTGSNIALFSREGILITGSGNLDYEAVLRDYGAEHIFTPQSQDTGFFYADAGGQEYLCTWNRAEDGGHLFLSMDNMSVLVQERDRAQALRLNIALALVLVAAVAAFFASRRLYSPVKALVRELKSGGKVDHSERDEMSAISRAVNDLLWEERQWFSGRSDEKIREATLMRLLSGETGHADEDIKKVLPYARNVCVLVSLGAAPDPKQNEAFDSRVKLLIKVIQEELEESRDMAVTAMRHSMNTVIAIVSVGEAVDDLEALMRAKLTALQAASAEILGKAATFSVGSLQDDLVGVWESFGQARRSLEYSYFYGTGSLLFYDDVCGPTVSYDAAPRTTAICQALRGGGKENVAREMDGLVSDMARQTRVSVQSATQILNRLATELIRYAEESEIRLEDVLENGGSIYQQLWDQPSFRDACAWLKEGFANLIDFQNASREVGNEHIRRVLEYVKAHYAEGITIDDIASYIGFSYSYLRKIFKDVTGRNLTDHINELRIKKAKQLLRDTTYTVREIAQQCGYTHERSFSRAFAQSENVSPGKYKEMSGR